MHLQIELKMVQAEYEQLQLIKNQITSDKEAKQHTGQRQQLFHKINLQKQRMVVYHSCSQG